MMRVTTLKASAGGLANLLSYYSGLAVDRSDVGRQPRGPVDYYLDPDEPAGRWWGAGRAALGVEDEVAPDALGVVLQGRHPASGEQLGRSFGDSSARGFDATFSAPKSVSVLWALTPDPWVRAEVLAAQDAAVDAALGWFETHGAVTRRGRDGVQQVDTLGVAAALFRQHTSRTMDPQLHTHAVISAKVQDPTGRWLSLDARFLKYQQRTIGWIYDAALRSELTGRLGVAWTDLAEGPADLACVPEKARALFSLRTAQVDAKRIELIERWSAEHDGLDPDARTIASLERAAVLATRPPKRHGREAADLHRTWATQAASIGIDVHDLTPERIRARSLEPPALDRGALAAEAVRRITEESSTWLRADLARHVATLLPPEAASSADALIDLIDQVADRAEELCVSLGPELPGPCRHDGRGIDVAVTEARLTTELVLEQETGLQHWAASHAYPTGPGTGDPQADAAAAMAGPAQVVLVVGPAGSGKTRTTAEAVRMLEERSRPVIGLAPSGKAADVLRAEAGCPTDTLAGFLTRNRSVRETPWPVGTTIIVDEAGMAATADLAELVAIARSRGWRIVAVGDPAQLPSVGRGGVFAHWCATVPHHELTTVHRFHEPWEAAASLSLRRGAPDIAETYAAHGRLHATHPALLPRRIADLHRTHIDAGRTVAITTTTTGMARAINEAIQVTQPLPRNQGVDLVDGTRAMPGDVVATRRNDPTLTTDLGERVRNRHVWTVEACRPDGTLAVHHPERGRVELPARYVHEHVELGWAVTGYGTQGDTVDVGIAVLEPGTTHNHAYVALTRGRETNHAWIPDPTGHLDPAEHLTGILHTTLERSSALSMLERLHEQAGLTPPDLERTQGRERSFGIER